MSPGMNGQRRRDRTRDRFRIARGRAVGDQQPAQPGGHRNDAKPRAGLDLDLALYVVPGPTDVD